MARVIAQLLPNETTTPEALLAAIDCVESQVRDVDHVGVLSDQTVAVVMPETDRAAAVVAGVRVMNELTLRSGHLNQRKWFVGVATVWEDCESADALLNAALHNSLRNGGRLAA